MHPRTAERILNEEFLEIRCRLIDLAAALDRIDAAPGREALADDPRLASIRDALALLAAPGPDRTERIQMVFSLPYDPHWRASRSA